MTYPINPVNFAQVKQLIDTLPEGPAQGHYHTIAYRRKFEAALMTEHQPDDSHQLGGNSIWKNDKALNFNQNFC